MQVCVSMQCLCMSERSIYNYFNDLLMFTLYHVTIATWQMITQVMIGLSDTLGLYPPPTGSVDPLPSPSESPHQNRKSNGESPLHSPVPVPTPGYVEYTHTTNVHRLATGS